VPSLKRLVQTTLGRNLSPALFALGVGCLLAAYLASVHDQRLAAVVAGGVAALAAAGVCLNVLRVDARLAAEETVARAALPVGETIHSFARAGQSSLLVFLQLDCRGRVVEASAYDPDEYS
jgi:hypothetical protein